MNSFSLAVSTCHKCPRRRRSAPSRVECELTGRDIAAHAQAHDCPENRYAARGLGDTVKAVLDKTGIGPVAKRVIRAVTGKKDCGCAGRRDLLNRLAPYGTNRPPRG